MSSEVEAPSDFPLRIGRVARALGLQGEVVAQLFRKREVGSPTWRRLKRPAPIELEHLDETLESYAITHVRWIDPIRAALRLAGVDDRDAAEALVGTYLDVDPERLPGELCDEVDACFGARVLDADSGDALGEVVAIRDNGAQALFEISLTDDPDVEVLVPVVPELVVQRGVDETGRFVRIRPLSGLFDVNR